ncbi:MAG: MCE family protein [Acidimicrobiia bacterium]|nr:MCE family protein [Acidimicrobiia bacterium]
MTGLIALTLFGSLTVFGVYLGAGKLSPKFHLHARFTAAGQGLQNGSDVKIHGINVGQVTTVHLVNGLAQVNMALNGGEKVPTNASATIRPKTLFGEKFVDIDPGPNEATGPFLKNNGFIKQTTGGFELEQVLTDLYPILQAVRPEDITTLLDTLARSGEGLGPEVNRQIVAFQQVSDVAVAHDADTREFLDDLTKLSDSLANSAPDLVAGSQDLNVALPDLNAQAGNLTTVLDQLTRLSSDAADILDANRGFLNKAATEGGKTLQLLYDERNQLPAVINGLREFFQVLGEAAGTLPDPSSPGTTLATVKFIVGGGTLCGGGHDAQHPPLPCQAVGQTLPPIPALSGSGPLAPRKSSAGAAAPPVTVPGLPPLTLPGPVHGVQAVTQLLGGLLR